jgi:hypothetical protein
MLSVLSRENAALREALNDTTRKLNELEDERQRLTGDPELEGIYPMHAVDSTNNGHKAVSATEAAPGTPHVASAEVGDTLKSSLGCLGR